MIFMAGKSDTCSHKPEFLYYVFTSEGAEKIWGSSAAFIVQYAFISRLTELSVTPATGPWSVYPAVAMRC